MKVSNEKLYSMVMGGSQPIVRVTKESAVPDLDSCSDEGMIGRIGKSRATNLLHDLTKSLYYAWMAGKNLQKCMQR